MRKISLSSAHREKILDAVHDARVDGRNYASEMRNVRNALVAAGEVQLSNNIEGRIIDIENGMRILDKLEEFVKFADVV